MLTEKVNWVRFERVKAIDGIYGKLLAINDICNLHVSFINRIIQKSSHDFIHLKVETIVTKIKQKWKQKINKKT